MPSQTKGSRSARFALWTPLLLAAALSSCRDLPTAAQTDPAVVNAPPPLAASEVSIAGRALAANCFQCHGTDGVAGELKIAGQSASGIISALNKMRTRNPRENIMNLHALAYTPAEIALIADYLSQQGD